MSQFIEMFGGGNWPEKCLGEVGSFTRGGGFLKSDYVEHGIPCIHYGQIHTKFGHFISSHITEISSDLESKTKFASKGDVIIAITSEDTEGSCKSTAWLGDYSVAVGGHAAIYKHSMNPLYMTFFFHSTLFNHAKMEYVHGTKVFEIRPDDIAKILVPCPPISLQEHFATIALQADKSEFDGFKSQFIEMFGNPQNNSQRRKTVRFDEVLTFQRGHDLPEKERKSEGAIPIYGSNGFVGYHTESKAKNGIVTGRSGTIGKVYCIKGDYWPLNTSLYSIDTHGNNLTYLKYMVEAFDVSRFSNGTGVPTLNRNDIHKEMIPLVDISEQEAFEVIAHQADKSENRRELRMAS